MAGLIAEVGSIGNGEETHLGDAVDLPGDEVLGAELLAVLKGLPHRDGYIFHGPRGGRLKPDTVRRILVREVIEPAGLSMDDINLIIPHQANTRILQVAAKQLGIPLERIYSNLDKYGNTSAASVPLALVEAIEEGRVHAGDHVVMVGFGGGLTWASSLWRL